MISSLLHFWRAPEPKVFGIGWAKTGTTTLGRCLTMLGYDHQSHRFDLVPAYGEGRLGPIRRAASRKQSFEDWPWPLLFRELDEWFPGSRFILTTRDSREWLKSYRRHLGRIKHITEEQNERRRILYGLPFPDVTDAQLIERYERHNRDVLDYFRQRPDDLLVVDWAAGDDWGPLCRFLGKPIPAAAFPHANQAPG